MRYDVVRRYGCDTTQVSVARSWVQHELDSRLPAEIVDDATLIVSELLTNAIRAGCTDLSVGLTLEPGCLRLGVTDDAPGLPVMRETAVAEPSGRGLTIVASLADDWGVLPFQPDSRKLVWATIAVR